MRHLIIGIFESHNHAEKARKQVLALGNGPLEAVDDVIVLEKTLGGKNKFHHLTHQALAGALFGTIIGAIVGLILIIPVLLVGGMIIGGIVGLISGVSTRIGIDPDFVEQELKDMRPGQSALCVQVRANPERVTELLTGLDLDLCQTRLYNQMKELLECRAAAKKACAEKGGFSRHSQLAAEMQS